MTAQTPETTTPTKRPSLAVILALVAVALSTAALIVSLNALGTIEQQAKEDRIDECSAKWETGSMEWFMCAEEAQ